MWVGWMGFVVAGVGRCCDISAILVGLVQLLLRRGLLA